MRKNRSKNKLVVGIIILFLVTNFFSVSSIIAHVKLTASDIVYVDDDAQPEWYDETHVRTIHEGITNASENWTIYVYSGLYVENVIVNKTVSLIGEDKDTTIIDGSGSDEVISIQKPGWITHVNWVNISGFTIENDGEPNHNGIWCKYNHDSVSDCNIKNCDFGIIIGNQYGGESNACTVLDCIFSNTSLDINLFRTTNSTIKNNTCGIHITGATIFEWNTHSIQNNFLNGKPVRYYKNEKDSIVPVDTAQVILANCTNITIHHLEFERISTPVLLGFSSFNNIYCNDISYSRASIIFEFSNYNNIYDNYIAGSGDFGIYLGFSHNNSIYRNIISDQYYFGICVIGFDNQIYHNNFINNTEHVYDEFTNNWDTGYPYGGNYWDNYTGIDKYHGPHQDIPGPDNIGDTPYIINDNSQDNYPLMKQFSLPYIPRMAEVLDP